ncbi:hypothetical protein BSZ28_06055 [Pseudomonas moraviensis]|nr:hypothetical protein BSZ28_06055 [Pseudomonas moraviensis]
MYAGVGWISTRIAALKRCSCRITGSYVNKDPECAISNVGASLLANAVCHSTMMSTDTTPSRAGSLPQGLACTFCK